MQVLEVGLLNYLGPALTLVLSVPLLGCRARPTPWPGAALALAGVALITGLGCVFWERAMRAGDHTLVAALGTCRPARVPWRPRAP